MTGDCPTSESDGAETDPEPVVVEFKTGDEQEFRKPDHDPHGETFASAAHSTTSCDNCGKTGLVLTHELEYAAGVFEDDMPERDVLCEHCGSLDHT